jgi:hypothetical protein
MYQAETAADESWISFMRKHSPPNVEIIPLRINREDSTINGLPARTKEDIIRIFFGDRKE